MSDPYWPFPQQPIPSAPIGDIPFSLDDFEDAPI